MNAQFARLPSDFTVVDVVLQRAAQDPDRIAYRFLEENVDDARTLTYGALALRATAVAVSLAGRAKPGDRALLAYPPGPDYVIAFYGCLLAGVLAVPTYPVKTHRSTPSLRAFARDSAAAVVLTDSATHAALASTDNDIADLPWQSTDQIGPAIADSWTRPELSPASPALLQYTSGSTSAPRGIIIGHDNLVANAALIGGFVGWDHSGVVSWLPPYHDMGLFGGIVWPLLWGVESTLFSPLAFLRRPALWLEAIDVYRASVSFGPNFAYDLCVRKITGETRERLDLTCWKTTLNGAEPIRPETIARFAAAFGPQGFEAEIMCPAYGLAEATLIVSGSSPDEMPVSTTLDAAALDTGHVTTAGDGARSRTVVSSGRPRGGQDVVIVDPETRVRMPAASVGEVWVSGPCVAHGYWADEAASMTFGARLRGESGGPYLRTGDLGFLLDGELYIVGRRRDLIVVAGRNIHPQDLEITAEDAHPAARAGCCIAFAREGKESEEIVVVQEIRLAGSVDSDEIVTAIRADIAAAHQLRPAAIVLIPPGELPKTSSGKKRRSVCRAAYLSGDLQEISRWECPDSLSGAMFDLERTEESAIAAGGAAAPSHDVIAHWLVRWIARSLGVAPDTIDETRPLVDFGLGSQQAAQLAADLSQWFGHDLPVTVVFDHPTVARLATALVSDRTPTVTEPTAAGSSQGK